MLRQHEEGVRRRSRGEEVGQEGICHLGRVISFR